ncbi:MAG: hypothetical protein HZA61_02500 [Candidatus Eisenbacteria bacterium]|uniref:EF-hand domain-containing protein n=1 Tax=Eiseniibacteriota bacterium TaxID=2212470 RepID=A0A933SDA3_UNCEI|nr:hypothetical protein [Candidatus Eisenbacteria bacterium]
MHRIIAVFALLLTASAAFAAAPSPTSSSVPGHIRVVGWNGVSADDAFGRFTITVRDAYGAPVANSIVLVDFAMLSDVRLGANQYDPSVVTNCPHRCVRKATGPDGTASFTVVGRGTGSLHTLGVIQADVWADGVLIGRPRVEIFDLDGANGLGANDMSLWMDDYGQLQYFGRGDYDGDGRLGANDLAIWLMALGGGGSTQSVPLACP